MKLSDFINTGEVIPVVRRRSRAEAPSYIRVNNGSEVFLYDCRVVASERSGAQDYGIIFRDASSNSIKTKHYQDTKLYERYTSFECLCKLYEVVLPPTKEKSIGKFKIKSR